jgi:hypothetical protein
MRLYNSNVCVCERVCEQSEIIAFQVYCMM